MVTASKQAADKSAYFVLWNYVIQSKNQRWCLAKSVGILKYIPDMFNVFEAWRPNNLLEGVLYHIVSYTAVPKNKIAVRLHRRLSVYTHEDFP